MASTHGLAAVPALAHADIKEWERVERSTLEMIAHVFPVPTLGQVFFARFLERAGRERSILPGEGRDAVYICTKSIATLGKELHFSNDTTQKYVVLYMALGLLKKRKFLGQLAFVLQTGIYHPPETLEASLDYLIQKKTSRPKLRTMAVEVKARCLIYGLIPQDLVASLEQLQVLLQIDKGTSRRTLDQRLAQAQHLTSKMLKTMLTARLSTASPLSDETRGQKNPPRKGCVRDETLSQEHQESTLWSGAGGQGKESPSENLPSQDQREDSFQDQQDGESTHEGVAGRFSVEAPSSRLPEQADQGDSRRGEQERESPQHGGPGRFHENHHSQNLPMSLSQGDSTPQKHSSESPLVGKADRFSGDHTSSRLLRNTGPVDSDQDQQSTSSDESPLVGRLGRREDDRLSANLPSLSQRVDSGSALRNVNVESIYNYIITSTLREPQRVAEFLAEQLEHDRRVSPKYHKLFHIQEGQARDPHVLAAAFLCTMVRLHRDRWTITRPGGFFTTRCREYDAGVPEEVEGWITRYGSLSLAALSETLAREVRPSPLPAQTQPVFFPGKPAPKPLSPPLALLPETRVEPARITMSKEEAQALAQAIGLDRRTQLFRTRCLHDGPKGARRYAVLVDASSPGGPPHQTVVYSRAEWQARLDSMKTWRDLISPSACDLPGVRVDSGHTQKGGELR